MAIENTIPGVSIVFLGTPEAEPHCLQSKPDTLERIDNQIPLNCTRQLLMLARYELQNLKTRGKLSFFLLQMETKVLLFFIHCRIPGGTHWIRRPYIFAT